MDARITWCICPNCQGRLDEVEGPVGDMRCVTCGTLVILVDSECLFSEPAAHGPFHRCTIERIDPGAAHRP